MTRDPDDYDPLEACPACARMACNGNCPQRDAYLTTLTRERNLMNAYLPVALLHDDTDPLVDEDGILIIADDGEPLDGDPLSLDPPTCPECGEPLFCFEGERFCADCLSYCTTAAVGDGPHRAA